jgi:glycosyltransferase involved in cell wall biosynthesis
VHVLHIAAGLWKDTGGPAEVIPNLCRAQAKAGLKVTLCLIDGDNALSVDALTNEDVEVKIFSSVDNIVRFSPQMAKYLFKQKNIDLIHNHGHWLWPNWAAWYFSSKKNIPLITTPHGTLVEGMLAISRAKKKLAWSLIDKKIIQDANIIHALSQAEKDGMLPKIGKNIDRVTVIPNGVNIKEKNSDRYKTESRTLLFLSRVAPIKGIVELLKAWSNVSHNFPNWQLQIVGPIDDSIKEVVETLANLSNSINLCGPVYDEDRWNLYSEASAFVLPSFGEGLPTVLLEAAASALPIITTNESNFKELIDIAGCIVVRPDVKDIESSLNTLTRMNTVELTNLGDIAYELVKEKYSWDSIARKWYSVYEEELNSLRFL